MTLRNNLTKGQKAQILEKKVSQLEMSTRVAQMLIQQIGNAVSPMGKDVGELASRQRELQYRVLAVQELLGLKMEQIQARAEELQIKDFTDSSDKEDAEKGYTTAEEVTEDNVVIFTSKTPADAADRGILRSKLLVKEIGFPQLKADLLGKRVGDVVTADVNGVTHEITVLGIRTVPAAQTPVLQEAANVAAATPETTH